MIVVSRPDKLSGAEIAAICQEAGMHAVRKNRYVILTKDLEKGYKANVKVKQGFITFILFYFGLRALHICNSVDL